MLETTKRARGGHNSQKKTLSFKNERSLEKENSRFYYYTIAFTYFLPLGWLCIDWSAFRPDVISHDLEVVLPSALGNFITYSTLTGAV